MLQCLKTDRAVGAGKSLSRLRSLGDKDIGAPTWQLFQLPVVKLATRPVPAFRHNSGESLFKLHGGQYSRFLVKQL